MDYKYLEQEYRDDTIVRSLHAREQEHYHYALDIANFKHMLTEQSVSDALRNDVNRRISETIIQMEKVEAAYVALEAQVADPVAHEAAVSRCRAERELLKAKNLKA